MLHKLSSPRIFSGLFMMVGLSLGGCSTALNGEFDCHAPVGVACRSLGDVDEMINEGHFDKNAAKHRVSMSRHQAIGGQRLVHYTTDIHALGHPLRHHEGVIRVWIAPFEDDIGNYHTPNYVYTVVTPGFWIDAGHPVKKGLIASGGVDHGTH